MLQAGWDKGHYQLTGLVPNPAIGGKISPLTGKKIGDKKASEFSKKRGTSVATQLAHREVRQQLQSAGCDCLRN